MLVTLTAKKGSIYSFCNKYMYRVRHMFSPLFIVFTTRKAAKTYGTPCSGLYKNGVKFSLFPVIKMFINITG